LNSDLPSAARCFGLYDDDNIVGFMGVLHQPHNVNKQIKRVCRLVILPDYQGIGLGTKFLNIVARMYSAQGFDFSIVTSAKNMIGALNKSNEWVLARYSVNQSSNNKNAIDGNRKTLRNNCKTASFFYKRIE
jgi:GNAT superfamily N-acetyltransferase